MGSPSVQRFIRAAGALLLLAGYATPLEGTIRSGYFFSLLTGPVIDGSLAAALHVAKPVGVLLIAFFAPAGAAGQRGFVSSGAVLGVAIEEFLFFLTLAGLERNSVPGWLGFAGAICLIVAMLPSLGVMASRSRSGTATGEHPEAHLEPENSR